MSYYECVIYHDDVEEILGVFERLNDATYYAKNYRLYNPTIDAHIKLHQSDIIYSQITNQPNDGKGGLRVGEMERSYT
jgi:hypothetical protein